MNNTSVTLRKKKISNGKKLSLYLDFYPAIQLPDGKSTRREFLKLYLFVNPSNPIDREHNKTTRQLAETIRSKRFTQLIEKEHGYVGKATKDINFLAYVQKLANEEITKRNSKKDRRSKKSGSIASMLFQLRKFSSQIRVKDVNEKFVLGFRTYLKDNTELSSNTSGNYFMAFKMVLKKATKENLFIESPEKGIKNLRREQSEINYLTAAELTKVISTPCENEVLKTAFLFGCYTGLRFGDIRDLTWGDITDTEGETYIKIKMEKGDKRHKIPLNQTAINLMGERKSNSDKVFKGLFYTTKNTTLVKIWIASAGVTKRITFHCSRHTFATLCLSRGVDLYTVSKLLGHSSISMTEKYAKVMDKDKIKAVKVLDD